MHAVNPRYVLRTHLAQRVIEAAQAGDSEPLHRLRERLAAPFEVHDDGAEDWLSPPPRSAAPVCLSCSS
jgi:uncharacterized protein YdiU (UPF0061 family)